MWIIAIGRDHVGGIGERSHSSQRIVGPAAHLAQAVSALDEAIHQVVAVLGRVAQWIRNPGQIAIGIMLERIGAAVGVSDGSQTVAGIVGHLHRRTVWVRDACQALQGVIAVGRYAGVRVGAAGKSAVRVVGVGHDPASRCAPGQHLPAVVVGVLPELACLVRVGERVSVPIVGILLTGAVGIIHASEVVEGE